MFGRTAPPFLVVVAFLGSCAPSGDRRDAPPSTSPLTPPVASSVIGAPEVVDLESAPYLPGCPTRELVTTPCGPTLRCAATRSFAYVRAGGAWLASSSTRSMGKSECLEALETARIRLEELEQSPLSEVDPTPALRDASSRGCPSLTDPRRAKAYADIETRVKARGRARVARIADPETKATWDAAMDRWGLDGSTVTCAADSRRFLLHVGSEGGAPGAIPYAGLWLVPESGPPRPLWENSDNSPVPLVDWSVGDLDGDGSDEIVTRGNPRERPSAELRYSLVDVHRDVPLVLLDHVKVGDDGTVVDEPRIRGVELPSGRVLLIRDDLFHYDGSALKPASERSVREFAAKLSTLRNEVREASAFFDDPLPAAGDPCDDSRRRELAQSLSVRLVATGGWNAPSARSLARKIAGLGPCAQEVP